MRGGTESFSFPVACLIWNFAAATILVSVRALPIPVYATCSSYPSHPSLQRAKATQPPISPHESELSNGLGVCSAAGKFQDFKSFHRVVVSNASHKASRAFQELSGFQCTVPGEGRPSFSSTLAVAQGPVARTSGRDPYRAASPGVAGRSMEAWT